MGCYDDTTKEMIQEEIMREIAIKTNQLTKKYKSFVALDNANITVYKDDVYGIVGRNGAGKTTLMKTITGLTNQTSGEYEIFSRKDKELKNQRRRVGCLIENPAFFGNMTAYENLKYYCIQKGITNNEKISEVLDAVNLTYAANKKFKSYSLGMKQRLGIALAILDDPDIIVLDEPINGLDPIGISELRETFHRLNVERGITILISSHILSELYAVATRFVFIDQGKVIKEITKEELNLECQRCNVIRTNAVDEAARVVEKILHVHDYKVINDREIRIYSNEISRSELNRTLVEQGIDVDEIFETGIGLEDYFKSLIA